MKYREVFLRNVQFLIKEKLINGKKYAKKDVEKMCGVSEGYLGRNGSRYSFELLFKLAVLYGITVDELVHCDLATQGIISKKIYNYLDKLRVDTKERLIEWNIYDNLQDGLGCTDNPFDVMEEGTDKTYRRYFQDGSGLNGELTGKVYVGDGYNKKIVLFSAKVMGVEGWELYVLDYENEYELAKPVGIFHTFKGENRVLLNKIYDLKLNIELSKEDIYISKDARGEMRFYMEDYMSEGQRYYHGRPDEEGCY